MSEAFGFSFMPRIGSQLSLRFDMALEIPVNPPNSHGDFEDQCAFLIYAAYPHQLIQNIKERSKNAA